MTPPVIRYSVKIVKNLGNFESVHVEAGAEDSPRERREGGTESAQEAFDRLKEFVEKNLVESVNEYVKDLKNQ